jgi:hypothetical protein
MPGDESGTMQRGLLMGWTRLAAILSVARRVVFECKIWKERG